MSFGDLLEKNRDAIVEGWVEEVLATYPDDGAALFSTQKDPFANPVGTSVREGTRGIFDALLSDLDPQTIKAHLTEMVKIRAVQQFTPSQALSFVFSLKSVIRRMVPEAVAEPRYAGELRNMDTRIDRVALTAFDLFMEAREEVSELRISEVKRQVGWILEKLNRRDPRGGEPSADTGPEGSERQFERKEDLR